MSTDETLLNDEVNVGDVLDERYELLELIGRGGCGLVFLAKDLNLDREVAVKVLAGEGVAQKETLEKFEQEGQILRRLHAQNTVFFYDNGETPQHLPYIVMEFVRGTPLNVVLEKEGRLPVKRAVSILSQVLTSLAEAHEYGFIHRDLKPGNIMLCERPGFPDDFVKVLDFGIAKVMGKDEAIDVNNDSIEDVAGTPTYMPPEQFKNEPLTPAADLYSMGCIAYEMLSGFAPFDGETLHTTVAKHLFMIPPSLNSAVDPYPNVAAVVFKLLEKNPANRFASAQQVIDVLEHWSEPELIPALAGCRIKGDDDDKSNTFYEKECAETVPLQVNSDFLSKLSTLPTTGPQPQPVGIGSGSSSGQIAAPGNMPEPPQKNMLPIFAVLGVVILGLVGALLYVFVFAKPAEEPKAPQADAAPEVPKEEPVVIKRYMIEDSMDALGTGAVSSAAFGILDNASIFPPVDVFSSEKFAAQEFVDKKPKKGQAAEAYDFELTVSPAHAKVIADQATTECAAGKCTVHVAAGANKPTVLVVAPGYQATHIRINKKITSAKVDLERP